MRAERGLEGRKGSEGVVVRGEENTPEVDAGSSKSNESGFGARVECSLMGRKRMERHEDRTHDGGAWTTQLLVLPSQHRLIGSFAIGCEPQGTREGLWMVSKVLRVLRDRNS